MSQGKGNEDPTVELFLLLFLVFGVLALTWYFARIEILTALKWFRWVELNIIYFLTADPQIKQLLDWLTTAKATRATGIGPDVLAQRLFTPEMASLIATKVNEYIRWIAVPVLLGLGVYALFYSPKTKFKNKFDLEGLIKAQSKVWQVISPIVKFNPGKDNARRLGGPVPNKLPIFAEALSPEEWLAYNRVTVNNGIPDREATRKALAAQLGPKWQGPEKMPLYMQGLYAAYALQGLQKRDECTRILNEMSDAWSPETGLRLPAILEKYIREVVADPELGGKANAIAKQHAYRTTALLGTLKWARNLGGVLASAQFLWLRAEDRALWYPLNCLGRRSFHIEGAGAMAHFMAEQNAKKMLVVPRVETAIVTLNQYLATSQATIPELETKA